MALLDLKEVVVQIIKPLSQRGNFCTVYGPIGGVCTDTMCNVNFGYIFAEAVLNFVVDANIGYFIRNIIRISM